MRTGLFCTYENPRGDYSSAYAEQAELVEHVERLGFDEAWVAEHHFEAGATSASPFAILAHLAARTQRLRLGSAAVLLPFRDPIQVAEDVATVDILSGGRFDFGIARGGPFPDQNRHFRVTKEEARARTVEALALIERLLTEDRVSFDGRFYKADGVALVPRPLQRPVPIYVATSTPDTLRRAAAYGHGLMGRAGPSCQRAPPDRGDHAPPRPPQPGPEAPRLQPREAQGRPAHLRRAHAARPRRLSRLWSWRRPPCCCHCPLGAILRG